MGKVRKLREDELVGGASSTDVYPVTSTQAVFNGRNVPLNETLVRNLPINVSLEYSDSDIPDTLTLLQAVSKIPTGDRVLGLNCRFLSAEGWKNYVYIGSTTEVSDWRLTANWLEYTNTTQLAEVEGSVTSLKKSTNAILGVENERALSTDISIDGKYVSSNGNLVDYDAYMISSSIGMSKGETVYFNARAAVIVAVISKVQEGTYTPLLLGAGVGGDATTEYSYTMEEDCSIVISSLKSSWDGNVNIAKSNIAGTQLALKEQQDVQGSEIESLGEAFKNIGYSASLEEAQVGINGKYIRFSDGELVEYDRYYISTPIAVKRGQYIVVTAAASDLVAVISSKNDDGTYKPLVRGISASEVNTFSYLANEDINIVISNYTSAKEKAEVNIIDFLAFELIADMNSLDSSDIEYTGPLQGYTSALIVSKPKRGDNLILNISSDDKESLLRIRIDEGENTSWYSGYSMLYTSFKIKKDVETVSIQFYSTNNSNVSYFIRVNPITAIATSAYEDRLKELDSISEPTINLPNNIQYKDIVVDTQILYNNLTETIKTKISEGSTNLNIIFKDNVFKFNNQNLISLSGTSNSSVNLRFCCDNAKIVSDGKQYSRENRTALSGARNVFDTDSTFNYKNSIVVNEDYIYPDINGGNGIFHFTDHITVVNSSSYIYKAPIPQDIDLSGLVGKKVCFTAWWAGVFADITDAKEEEGKKYIYFKISAGDASYVDADLTNYGVYPIVKILNLEDKSASNSYYIEDGKIHLPDADIVYQCEYPQFIDITNSTLGSVIFCNMYFIGSADSGKPLINASGTSNVFVLNSTFKNIGHACIFNTTSNGDNGNILVKGCTFYKCKHPVYLNGNNSSVRDNVFEKSGYYWQSGYAVFMLRGKNFYIGHNTIKDFTYSAISVSGGTNVDQTGNTGIIEYNTIETVDWDTDYIEHQLIDSGAIQISIVNFPVIIRHNFIDNYKTRKSGRGIMMGGNCSQIAIYKNLITNTPSYSAIDFYKGTEKNQYYPNGVEDLLMYNIVEGCIRMIGGDDFTNYSSYTKDDNDCVCGYNLIGDTGYNISNQLPNKSISDVPYFEMPIIDDSFSYKNKGHILLSYDVSSWNLSDFIMGKLQLSIK